MTRWALCAAGSNRSDGNKDAGAQQRGVKRLREDAERLSGNGGESTTLEAMLAASFAPVPKAARVGSPAVQRSGRHHASSGHSGSASSSRWSGCSGDTDGAPATLARMSQQQVEQEVAIATAQAVATAVARRNNNAQ